MFIVTKKLKQAKWTQNSYKCESVLARHLESRNEPARGTLVACKVFSRENISYLSEIELPHHSVNFYPNVYIYCGIQGNNRSWNKTEDRGELYPKCKVKCQNESNVFRRNIKPVVVLWKVTRKKRLRYDFRVCGLNSSLTRLRIKNFFESENKSVIGIAIIFIS